MRALLAASMVSAVMTAPSAAQQGPIHTVFDFHCDPISNAIPLQAKQLVFAQWVADMNAVMDAIEPLGARPSFNATGPFLELVVAGGTNGPGADLVRRMYAAGGMVGSHSHTEYQAGPFDWPSYGTTATLEQARVSWSDAIQMAYAAIDTCWPGGAPESKAQMVDLKEYHIPTDEAEEHQLFQEFSIHIRSSNGVWPFYDWYDHHIWQPHRPAVADPLEEDLSAFMVASPVGRVIGLEGDQNQGQDMTADSLKRQFLQLYVNWRFADRTGAPEKVWSWGFGAHAHDVYPGSPSRTDIVDVISWLSSNFLGKVEPATGSTAMVFASHREVVDAYVSWEGAHPGESHFHYAPDGVDWAAYPYLRSAAEELARFDWVSDLDLGPGVQAFLLRRGPTEAVLLWSDAGPTTLDVSSWVGPRVRVVNLESGLLEGTDPTAVQVDAEARVVTEFAPGISLSGTPALGQSFTLRVDAPPGSPAWLLLAQGPGDSNFPYVGRLLLDPSSLVAFPVGVVPSGGELPIPLFVPADPGLSGLGVWFQGLIAHFGGASLKLTDEAVAVQIP